jgi:hypothetical protein
VEQKFSVGGALQACPCTARCPCLPQHNKMKVRLTSETARDMGIKATTASKYSRMLTKVPNPQNRENYSNPNGMGKSRNIEL